VPLTGEGDHVRVQGGLRRRRTGRRLAAVAASLLVAATSVAGAVAAVRRTEQTAATTTIVDSVYSRALRSSLHFLVQLPPGYATSSLRYPVVYFLHGLPAGPTSYQSVAWVGRELATTGKPAILVLPQGTRRQNGDPEYHDWGPGHDWETALAVELPAYIDAHYRTIASRSGRAIAGLSAGGYGATIIGLHHPARYSVIESWSGYFRPTDPTGEKTLDLGSDAANTRASVAALVPSLARQFRRYPTLLAFYVGSSDPTFVPDNVNLDRELRSAGVRHVFELYPGGHTTSLWQAHAAGWLKLALDHLAAPRQA
jgi:enterochelin esterase-like enzyme